MSITGKQTIVGRKQADICLKIDYENCPILKPYPLPFPICSVLRCGVFPVPERGYVISSKCPNYYGAKCNVACNTGYQLSTNTNVATVECGIDDYNGTVWKPNQLSCNRMFIPIHIVFYRNPLSYDILSQ